MEFDLDKVLFEIGGWGKFQIQSFFFLSLVAMFSVFHYSYIFVARDINYRCSIETCDKDKYEYNPNWLTNAVPYDHGNPSRCTYYQPLSNSTCTFFNSSVKLSCDKFVYQLNQTTIVNDFELTCDENVWKLTLVGTINAVGGLCCLSIAGFISDRYGRKFMVVVSIMMSSIIGFLKSFSFSYVTFLILEFLDTVLSSGMYSGAFILALETVDAKKRGIATLCLSSAFALGQIIMGLVAWLTPSWRIMLRILYIPGLLILISLWNVPESIRWLISRGDTKKAKDILQLIARTNKKKLSDDVMRPLNSTSYKDNKTTSSNNAAHSPSSTNSSSMEPLMTILKSKTLLLRTIHCSFTWICCVFPYYGLSIQSVALSKDIYINFISTASVEIPAYFLTSWVLEKYGRKFSLAFALILGGVSCILVHVSEHIGWLALVVFLGGKFFITVAYTTLYVYTAEMFPTNARHTAFSICAMFGRFGSMLAPQVPLLTRLYKSLPLIIFSIMAVLSGLFAFLFPETHNIKLPDKVDEAEHIEEAKMEV